MKKSYKLLMIFIAFILVACSEQDTSSTEDAAAPGAGGTSQENSVEDSGSNLIGEKVIKTVTLNYETLEYSDTISHILNAVNQNNAYIEYSYESSYSPSGSFGPDAREYKRVDYTLRVPTESLNTFLSELEGMEAVKVSEQIGSEDVTQTYRDTEARIEVLNQKEARLTELLNEATTIEQILLIEDNLSETIAERETLQSQLESIDDLVAYTEVYLTVSERQRISDTRGDGIPFWERLKEAVLDSIFVFYYWLQDAVIWLVYALPFILIIGILFLLYLGISRWYHNTTYFKKRNEKKEELRKRQKERIEHRKASVRQRPLPKKKAEEKEQQIKNDKDNNPSS
ncbi:DUF4349 domain-containing protein [Jeotgalibaca ciconiae]|uniref:DUF4349 domain-containing protein n=1 Tax=Jeotgalibaca ciconiae TaxID=2496265 RepID=A0A3Q9BIR7_9LACT|nr:DUF4349 domain-containing protein [Jeotgalibaca ciconiae]AZP03291.1 DUF4349 domain-containing protein [Jeotgalibaca ciconiae]